MNINGKKLRDVWNSFTGDQKDKICLTLGKSFVYKRFNSLDKELYSQLNLDQKSFFNLMNNRSAAPVNYHWNVVSKYGNPEREGNYWVVLLYDSPNDEEAMQHGIITTRAFLDVSDDDRFYKRRMSTMDGVLDYQKDKKCTWMLDNVSYINERVYAWLDAPIHEIPLPRLPEGVKMRDW